MVALRNEPVTMTAYRVEGMPTDGFMPDRLFGDALRRARQGRRRTPPPVPGIPAARRDPARPIR